jgi:MFS family permease
MPSNPPQGDGSKLESEERMVQQVVDAKTSQPGQGRERRLVAAAAFIGTTVEYYDFYLYATASALVFKTEFFPQETDALTALIVSFATYGVGFVARPLGGVVAGHFGDRTGRKRVLVWSLLVMGAATALIGVLPTYEHMGFTALVGLVTLRLVQGIASGAEWGGSALLTVEHAPRGLRGLFGSFTQTGSAAGMLLSTGVFTVVQGMLGTEAFLAWGWRIPFLLSIVLVIIGLVVRVRVHDAPEFLLVQEEHRVHRLPVRDVLRRHPRGVLITAGLRLAQPAIFSIMTAFALSYLVLRRGDSSAGLTSVLIVSALSLLTTPLWGWASDRLGRRPIAVCASIAIGVLIWPYFGFLDRGPLALLPLVTVIGMNVLHDAIYGPQAAWFAEQFPAELRYSGISLGYQVGSILSVGLTPLLASWFIHLTGGDPWPVCALVSGYAVVSLIAALLARDPVESELRARRQDGLVSG